MTLRCVISLVKTIDMPYPVTLFIYDLSQGMARSLGPALGLHDLEGVWHTSIVVHNTEIFFGGSGIEHCLPGGTMLGGDKLCHVCKLSRAALRPDLGQ